MYKPAQALTIEELREQIANTELEPQELSDRVQKLNPILPNETNNYLKGLSHDFRKIK